MLTILFRLFIKTKEYFHNTLKFSCINASLRISMVALFFLFFNLINKLEAKVFNPIHWTFSQDVQGNKIRLYFKAKMDTEADESKWYIYSQNQESNDGPIPLTFDFQESPENHYRRDSTVIEPPALEKYESVFMMTVRYFKDSAVFTQEITRLSGAAFAIQGNVNYQTCNGAMCLPPDDASFEFSIPADDAVASIAPISTDPSLLAIFLAGFLGGLFALLTPCVFPMIPITVSYFSKKGSIFRPLFYALSIIIIYVSLGLLITTFAGPDALNAMASDAFFNLLFFFTFMLFALSFLGLFDLSLPSSWLTKIDQQAGQGGYLGIFFMAFTLALVSFSCTGPLIGTLLVEVVVGGNYLSPAIGMLGFSSALAFPFAFLSFFPSLLQKLPRSGAWLNRVKVILGFIEIALALKFLSVVDLAYHWDFLTREIFVALWIALFALLGFYLLGLFRFSHDSPNENTSISSFFLALFSFAFCIYLLPGMFGAPLRLLSGIAPPRTHSEDQFRFIQGTKSMLQTNAISLLDEKLQKKTELTEIGPHGLTIYKDYEVGQQVALANHRPILLDFTGFSCVNCRKMEDNIWSDPSVLNLLQQFVIVSLYVDDKKELPISEQYISPITQKKIRNIGNKWSDFQIKHYQTNSQPYYVALDPSTEKQLHVPVVYLPDIVQYAQFLQKSLDNYQIQMLP